MVEFELFENDNGFINVIDFEGEITINITEESFVKIVSCFNKHIVNKKPHNQKINLLEEDVNIELDFVLTFNDNFFCLNAKYRGSFYHGSFYHDFDLNGCDIKTWNKIKTLIPLKYKLEKLLHI